MDLLLGSERAEADRRAFMKSQLVFWLLAGIDGHAKNFPVFLLSGGGFRPTPQYDVLSAHPMLGHGRRKLAPQEVAMAMALEGKDRHYNWSGIRLQHWLETGKRCGIADMEGLVRDVVDQTPAVIAKINHLIPAGFPAAIGGTILDGVRAAANELGDEIAASALHRT